MPGKELLEENPESRRNLKKNRAWEKLVTDYPEGLVKDALRESLEILRESIKTGEAVSMPPHRGDNPFYQTKTHL